jgi:hypothetical protein
MTDILSIPYRFFDYQQAAGPVIRTVHVAETEQRQAVARRLEEEQVALPEGSRRQIRVLGVADEYPNGWDPTADATDTVDHPALVWGHATVSM